jgi:NhaP-type Na+/H+ or K+/H+ antiporter
MSAIVYIFAVSGTDDGIVRLGVLHVLMPQLTYISCLAISACLTPTDPIICAAIVGESFDEIRKQ